MRFAVLADIHGNAFALEAVLQDMEALGLTEAVNLGDIFSGPIDAARTAALLKDRDFLTIRGNHDRYLITQARAEMGPSDRVAFDQLDQGTLDWIAQLPQTATYQSDVFLCHGTPSSDSTYMLERVEPGGMVRAATLEETLRAAKGVSASLILCAHSHLPRSLVLPDGRTIVNPGSVGCPAYDDDQPVYHVMQTGSPPASYAVMQRQGAAWTSTFRSVPYPAHLARDCAEANGRPDWARALASGWFES